MSLEKAKAHLEKYGLTDRISVLDHSSATVLLAAQALGTEPARIAKSLSFLTGDGPVMILTAGDMKIDNGKYKSQFGCKAKMIPPSDVEALIGHPVGGVCPFGCSDTVQVWLDVSLKRFDTVYPACGTANSAVRLTCEELEQCSECKGWVDVCKLV